MRDFLRDDVAASTLERQRFLARVAANSLDIVLRDAQLGPAARSAEQTRLEALLGAQDTLQVLRWQLVHGLREGRFALGDLLLTAHLRQTVTQQVLIDQPGYPGVRQLVGG